MKAPRLILDNLVFPEGPRWHAGKLWLSDMHAHRVLTVDEDGHSETMAEFDDRPSGLGFLPDGAPLAVLMRKRQVVRFGGGTIALHGDFRALPGHRLAEMVVDGVGRAYVGSKEEEPKQDDPRSPESIVLVQPDGEVRLVADDMWGPNGSAVTPDGKTLLVAESRANRISAFSIMADGSLTGRRIFAELESVPDGICLDAEGAVWVGDVHRGQFLRIRDGGQIADRVTLPEGKWAVACVLGGRDRRTLFMATAYETLEHFFSLTDFQADLSSTSKGFLEAIEVQVPGAGWP